MKYDIFISYRRKGGSERAELLKVILEKRGYKSNRVFMDTHSPLGGDFKQRIKDLVYFIVTSSALRRSSACR